MSHRADEIRKRLAKRRKQRPESKRTFVQNARTQDFPAWQTVKEQEKHKLLPDYEYQTEHPPEFNGRHPLISAHSIILKCLLAACLVLISAIAYKTDKQPLSQIKPAIAQTFQKEFQFAAVSNWFVSSFGNPLAFLTPGTKRRTVRWRSVRIWPFLPRGKSSRTFKITERASSSKPPAKPLTA